MKKTRGMHYPFSAPSYEMWRAEIYIVCVFPPYPVRKPNFASGRLPLKRKRSEFLFSTFSRSYFVLLHIINICGKRACSVPPLPELAEQLPLLEQKSGLSIAHRALNLMCGSRIRRSVVLRRRKRNPSKCAR